VNYLCLLGWSPKGNREKVPTKEVVELFDLPQILRHNARFDLNKLHWLNGEYIKDMSSDRFHELSVHALARVGIDTNKYELEYVKAGLDTAKQKVKLFSEVPTFTDFYFKDEVELPADMIQKDFPASLKPNLKKLRDAYAALPTFDPDTLNNTLKKVAAELGVSVGVLVHPLRLATTGRTVGPSLYHLLEVLGKDRVLHRIDQALARME
jgi:glutamyl/glutaminyl-tRNA synthetase